MSEKKLITSKNDRSRCCAFFGCFLRNTTAGKLPVLQDTDLCKFHHPVFEVNECLPHKRSMKWNHVLMENPHLKGEKTQLLLYCKQLIKHKMKRVRINKQKVGLVYRKGDFHRVLLAGNHWLGFNDKVMLYDQLQIYTVLSDMELVLKDEQFSKNIEQISIKENEIALVYVRENFSTLLTSGNYFYFKGMIDLKIDIVDLNSIDEISSIDLAILKNHQVAHYVKTFKLENYEKGLLFQDGKFIKELSGGSYSYWYGSHTLELLKVDLRNTQMELSGQELLTKDKAAVRMNFQLEYHVFDIQKALLENSSFSKQLYTTGQLAMREIVGSMTLDELLEAKESVGEFVLKSLKDKSGKLGVQVVQAGIRDIILPGEVKEIMNQVLIAEKKAQANAIARREETASTRTMLNTAKLMEDNSVLLKLKEMEYVEKIADKIGEIKLSSGGAIVDQLAQILTR